MRVINNPQQDKLAASAFMADVPSVTSPPPPPPQMRIEYDTVIIGGGPAGLAAAIRFKQLAQAARRPVSVCVLEKGPKIGAAVRAGAVVLKPRVLDELIPGWQAGENPLRVPVERDEMYFFTGPDTAVKVPPEQVPAALHNAGAYVARLAELCCWLAARAEALGVDILTGCQAVDLFIDEADAIRGVLADTGQGHAGQNGHQAGPELRAAYTVFAEGSQGRLGQRVIRHYGLDRGSDPQRYGLGIIETWKAHAARHRPGLVIYGGGWPLSDPGLSGGFFIYHETQNRISLGLIVKSNQIAAEPDIDEQFARLKQHPRVGRFLEDGGRLSHHSAKITRGGYFSLPKMVMPGGMLIGCDAGTLNFTRLNLPASLTPPGIDVSSLSLPLIKGSHTAMKSGILAAETIFAALAGGDEGGRELDDYYSRLKQSWLHEELYGSGDDAEF